MRAERHTNEAPGALGMQITRVPISDEHEGLMALRLHPEPALLMTEPELRGGLLPCLPADRTLASPAVIKTHQPVRVPEPMEHAA